MYTIIKSKHINFFPAKDKLHRIGGSCKFSIKKNVLDLCSQAHIKFDTAFKKRREAEQQEDERKRPGKIHLEKNRSLAQRLEETERKVRYSFRKFRIFL